MPKLQQQDPTHSKVTYRGTSCEADRSRHRCSGSPGKPRCEAQKRKNSTKLWLLVRGGGGGGRVFQAYSLSCGYNPLQLHTLRWHMCVCIHININININIYIYTCLCMYVYNIYIYTHMYIAHTCCAFLPYTLNPNPKQPKP